MNDYCHPLVIRVFKSLSFSEVNIIYLSKLVRLQNLKSKCFLFLTEAFDKALSYIAMFFIIYTIILLIVFFIDKTNLIVI